ncbi:hypothetical protein A3J32_03220 [Candidatus Saccharibacteria bacterium RIFCSPLOWO2_02_FULL_46_7]|nr:MAG: hypothetical protein A3J32_03220 [Candidatus Saccharibacteria bacterium RIFCSPLOWO2_02_FULL_46_7]
MVRFGGIKGVPTWLKTKAGIAGLATIIIAPAGALALRAQTPDDSTLQNEITNSGVAAQSTDPGQDSSGTAKVDQTTSNASTETSVTVDGQTIDVPANGTIHKEIKTANGLTTIDITTQNSSSADNSSTLSQNSLHVSSQSHSTVKSQGQSASN